MSAPRNFSPNHQLEQGVPHVDRLFHWFFPSPYFQVSSSPLSSSSAALQHLYLLPLAFHAAAVVLAAALALAAVGALSFAAAAALFLALAAAAAAALCLALAAVHGLVGTAGGCFEGVDGREDWGVEGSNGAVDGAQESGTTAGDSSRGVLAAWDIDHEGLVDGVENDVHDGLVGEVVDDVHDGLEGVGYDVHDGLVELVGEDFLVHWGRIESGVPRGTLAAVVLRASHKHVLS